MLIINTCNNLTVYKKMKVVYMIKYQYFQKFNCKKWLMFHCVQTNDCCLNEFLMLHINTRKYLKVFLLIISV